MDIGKLMKDEAPTAEFQFSDRVWVTIRYIAAPELRAINAKARTIGWNAKHQREERIDSEKASQMIGEAALLGWRGILRDGRELSFSPEMRNWLMLNMLDFSNFVVEKATEFAAFVETDREEGKKNSSPTSGPGASIQE
jgi:hypothetical protein